LRAWRPFAFAQDMLGAINFLKVVLLKNSKVRIYEAIRQDMFLLFQDLRIEPSNRQNLVDVFL
jgi:hypothetical protein